MLIGLKEGIRIKGEEKKTEIKKLMIILKMANKKVIVNENLKKLNKWKNWMKKSVIDSNLCEDRGKG